MKRIRQTSYSRPSIADQLLARDPLTQVEFNAVYGKLKFDGAAESTLKRLRKVAKEKGLTCKK